MRSVGRYLIEGELGRGGMGIVYLGRDPRLGREVALKSLPASITGDHVWSERFTREAKALASLHHPNIARIHGLQLGSDGTPFLILERVHGETLAHRLERGAMPPAEVLEVGIQIAAALEAAHERGIVHRDLKPGNLMISPWGRVKVLDFGLARRTGDAREAPRPGHAPTASGATIEIWDRAGTPGYMSPEQILGLAQDGRSDIFALGCILFECLAGRAPFARRTIDETLAAALIEAPDLPARSDLTPALRTLFLRLLEKDPARRPVDMREVREGMEQARASTRGEAEAPRGAATGIPHNLPPERDRFIGRSRERAEVTASLGRSRLLTITGPGGSGKTRLALKVGAEARAAFPDGVWFADLSPIADPTRVPDALATVVGARSGTGRTLIDSLVDHLSSRHCLVILDNCEHVMSACTLLASRLLEGCPALRLLATSREWLGVHGEETYLLAPMEVPEANTAGEPQTVAEVESVRLFVDRARRLRPGFQIDADTAPLVVKLCRWLDGIPLAIELAAAQLDTTPLDAVHEWLPVAGVPPTDTDTPASMRQYTLDATIRWSYDRLHDDEQGALRALSIFAGGCTVEAAAAVLDLDEFAALDALTRLVDRSLLTVAPSRAETRYRLLESVRHFAGDALRRAEGEDACVARHARFFARLAEQAEPELTGPAQAEWLARLDRDHDNLLLAVESSLRRNTAAVGTRLAAALYRFWFTRGHYLTGRQVIARVLEQDRAPEPSAARAKILWGAGNLAVFQGERAEARPLFEQSLAEYRTLGDVPGTARALNGLGLAAQDGGDPSRARAYFEQSLALFRSIGELRGMGAVIGNLSVLLWYEHEYAAARPLMEEAVEMSRAGGATDNLVQALADLGLLLVRGGEDRDAVAPLRECLGLVRELEARRAAVGALEAVAELVLNAGDAARSARGFGAAAALRTAIGVPPEPYEQRDRASVLQALDVALGPEGYARHHAAGAALTFEQAVEEALALLSTRAGQGVSPGGSSKP